MKKDMNEDYIFYPYKNGVMLLKINDLKVNINNFSQTVPTISELKNLGFCLYFLSPNSEALFMNDKALEVCGHESLKKAYGKTIEDIADPASAASAIRSHKHTMESNSLNILEEDVFLKDSSGFTSISFLKPWYNSEGKTIGVFGCSLLPKAGNFTTELSHLAELGILNNSISNNTLPILPGIEIDGNYLSSREAECLKLYLEGLSAKQIGRLTNLSYRTVEYYIESVKNKFHLSTKADLIAKFKERRVMLESCVQG